MTAKRAQLILNPYPVLMLRTNSWRSCSASNAAAGRRWCHIVNGNTVLHTLRWAPRDLWEQVAHKNPTAPNATKCKNSHRNARHNAIKRADGECFFV